MRKNKVVGGITMKKTHKFPVIFALMMFTAAAVIWAQPYYGYGQGYQDDYFWWDQLNLTQEQRGKIDRLQQEFYRETDSLQAELDEQYRKLDELERNPAAARSSLDKTWDRITELQNRLDEKWESHNQRIRNLLTPEQRQQLDDFGYGYGPGFIGTPGYGRGGGFYRGGGEYFRGGGGFYRGGGGYYRGRGGFLRGRGGNYRGGRGMSAYPYSRGLNRGRGYYNYGRGPCGRGLGKWYYNRDGRGYGWRR